MHRGGSWQLHKKEALPPPRDELQPLRHTPRTTFEMLPKAATSRLLPASSTLSVQTLAAICSRKATKADYPLASSIANNIPIYDLPKFSGLSPSQRSELQNEWYQVLLHGPGVFVTAGLYRDKALLDEVNGVYASIIEAEKRNAAAKGDHFAAGGKNDRIWNSFSKHALADPKSFVAYYSNPYLALVSSSWLGPGYRVTAQVNNVKPGGSPQECHRDYHLGFQSQAAAAQFPRAAHLSSQFLTLQGGVAHVDVPLETGPTRLLPYSQTYEEGYMAWREAEFKAYFEANYVTVPMGQGDGLFFNPALFHAAGANSSADVNRMVNLLQISSAFGKTMETIETAPVVERCWEEMGRMYGEQGWSDEVEALLGAVGEGYPFPTNLDKNQPEPDELTPPSEQSVLRKALKNGLSKDEVMEALRSLQAKSRA
ncbi:unnamed protein product [Clonostachys solani]|uniref:Phytanoyl-CoA dioxygenase n=1 Tax=Clonostachys solani TaxID=160281 RepID=A0A9N9ZJN3_9HYPO|nr:unnamed protein product [Clonostachys solani]